MSLLHSPSASHLRLPAAVTAVPGRQLPSPSHESKLQTVICVEREREAKELLLDQSQASLIPPFPYARYVPPDTPLPGSAHEAFHKLCLEPLENHWELTEPGWHKPGWPRRIAALEDDFPYRRYPLTFGRHAARLWSDLGACFEMDSLSDYFQEQARAHSRPKEFPHSAWELWHKHHDKVREDAMKWNDGVVSDYTLARSLSYLAPRAGRFRPTVARCIYQLFRARRVLDPCAGWGDRLLAALSCQKALKRGGTVEAYLGVDPNRLLVPGHARMSAQWEVRQRDHPGSQFRVLCAPIQSLAGELRQHEPFDLVFTSPPFFDREIYTEDTRHNPGQSVTPGCTVQQWKADFLFPMLELSWRHLEYGGHMVISLNDFASHMEERVHYVRALNDYLSTLPRAEYVGCIPFYGKCTENKRKRHKLSPQPLWCWKKQAY